MRKRAPVRNVSSVVLPVATVVTLAMVATLAVPSGVAQPTEARVDAPIAALATDLDISRAAISSTAVLAAPRRQASSTLVPVDGVPDGAKLLLVGTALFGLAAVIRRHGQA
jgi:hypothetical protein